MSLYLSVDHYKHAAQTHPNGNGERVLEVTDALDQLGRKLDAVRFTDEAFAQEQVTQLSQPQHPAKLCRFKLFHWHIKSYMAAPSKTGLVGLMREDQKPMKDTPHPEPQLLLTN